MVRVHSRDRLYACAMFDKRSSLIFINIPENRNIGAYDASPQILCTLYMMQAVNLLSGSILARKNNSAEMICVYDIEIPADQGKHK